ncbi:MAG: 1-acyl-sn-glycerol-3-phosphate acyltransferase [Myxococcales bacterium]|nr:1-acyl-sn-glycerol-3-phosphate acyltransferase [Myxococcales bacterium]
MGSGLPRALPVPIPTKGLPTFEAWAVRAFTAWNTSLAAKRASWWFARTISHTWIQAAISNRLVITGADHVRAIDDDRGVVLVANHRTFWDMYIATSVIASLVSGHRSLYFPVRARFFYTHPVGALLNVAVSAGSMWPPIRAGFDRAGRNAAALTQLAHMLERPRTLAGIHPEGTRNHRADPLDLLPAKGGAGRLVQACGPDVQVLPFFLCGITNDFVSEVISNFRGGEHRGPDIRIAFGEVRRASDYARDVPAAVVARQLLAQVREVGEDALRD